MATYKVGDVLEAKTSDVSDKYRTITITRVVSDGIYSSYNMSWTRSYLENNFRLVHEAGPINFILQYELDEDPFETFATMKEVEARIKELAKRADLKRDSIKVYEVAKTYDVKLETRVIFGEKVTLTEAKKVGRPRKFYCAEHEAGFKSGQALGAHKRYNHARV